MSTCPAKSPWLAFDIDALGKAGLLGCAALVPPQVETATSATKAAIGLERLSFILRPIV